MIIVSVALLAMIAGVYFGKISRNPAHPEIALSADALDQLLATRLPDESGVVQAISQWQGKTRVINFWATWCPPCREEMPAFSRLQDKYAANGVQFVGISLDTTINVEKYSKQFKTTYPLLIDNGASANLLAKLGNPQQALPYTLVLSPSNQVLMQQLGKVPEGQLDAALRKVRARQ